MLCRFMAKFLPFHRAKILLNSLLIGHDIHLLLIRASFKVKIFRCSFYSVPIAPFSSTTITLDCPKIMNNNKSSKVFVEP